MKVSRSEVVTKILANFNFITLLITSSAVWSCPEESQFTSLFALALDLAPFPPRPLAAGAEADFSVALVSTAATVHCSKNPKTSNSCLWCCIVSCSSASKSAWTMSACAERPETIRSSILLRALSGIWEEVLSRRERSQSESDIYYYRLLGIVGAHLSRNCRVSK